MSNVPRYTTTNINNFLNLKNENIKDDNTLKNFCKDPNKPTNMEVMRWAAVAYNKMQGNFVLENTRK